MSDAPKKTLIPELLPTPAISHPRMKSPRERVQAHVRALLKVSAAASAALLAQCGPATGGGGGYGVVDPLPPPAQCRDTDALAASASARATMGDVLAAVLISPGLGPYGGGGRSAITAVTVGSATHVVGGTVKTQTQSASGSNTRVDLTFTPDPGASMITFDLPFDCVDDTGSVPSVVQVTVFLTRTPDGGIPDDGGSNTDGGTIADGPLEATAVIPTR